jgi:hypothetical protein
VRSAHFRRKAHTSNGTRCGGSGWSGLSQFVGPLFVPPERDGVSAIGFDVEAGPFPAQFVFSLPVQRRDVESWILHVPVEPPAAGLSVWLDSPLEREFPSCVSVEVERNDSADASRYDSIGRGIRLLPQGYLVRVRLTPLERFPRRPAVFPFGQQSVTGMLVEPNGNHGITSREC